MSSIRAELSPSAGWLCVAVYLSVPGGNAASPGAVIARPTATASPRHCCILSSCYLPAVYDVAVACDAPDDFVPVVNVNVAIVSAVNAAVVSPVVVLAVVVPAVIFPLVVIYVVDTRTVAVLADVVASVLLVQLLLLLFLLMLFPLLLFLLLLLRSVGVSYLIGTAAVAVLPKAAFDAIPVPAVARSGGTTYR